MDLFIENLVPPRVVRYTDRQLLQSIKLVLLCRVQKVLVPPSVVRLADKHYRQSIKLKFLLSVFVGAVLNWCVSK